MRVDAHRLCPRRSGARSRKCRRRRDRVDPPAGRRRRSVGTQPPAQLDRVPGDVRPEVHDRRDVSEGRPGPGRAVRRSGCRSRWRASCTLPRRSSPRPPGRHVRERAAVDVRRGDFEDAAVETLVQVETVAEGDAGRGRLDGEGGLVRRLSVPSPVVDECRVGQRVGIRRHRPPERRAGRVGRGPPGRQRRRRHAVEALRRAGRPARRAWMSKVADPAGEPSFVSARVATSVAPHAPAARRT